MASVVNHLCFSCQTHLRDTHVIALAILSDSKAAHLPGKELIFQSDIMYT